MTKLLIVEDERMVREAIGELINWGSLGVQLIGLAADGLDAITYIEEQAPDIILLDIKMPEMDGLELVEWASHLAYPIEFILLSGWAEFEYARLAMRYGVRHYLLKPSNEKEIVSAVLSAQEKIIEQKETQALASRYRRLAQEIQRERYYHFWEEALVSQKNAKLVMQEHIQQNNLQESNCALLSIPITQEAYLAENNLLLDAFRLCGQGEIFGSGILLDYKLHYVVLDRRDGNTVDWQEIFPKTSTPITVQSFSSVAALLDKLLPEMSRSLDIALIDTKGNRQTIYNSVTRFRRIDDLGKQMMELAQAGNPEQAGELMDKLLNSLDGLENIRNYSSKLLWELSIQAGSYHTHSYQEAVEELYQLSDCEQLKKSVQHWAQIFLCGNSYWNEKNAHKVVRQIKLYVETQMACGNLSLKWIAENVVHLNVDYLSRLFAEEAEERYSNYLNRVRMERAMLLLTDKNNRIQAVAEEVGCGHNPRYFSQIFKKYTGKTPSEFQDTVNS